MNAFELRTHVIDDYARYAKSFLRIHDDRVREFVHAELDRGTLWPEPLVQLNPCYEMAGTIEDLVRSGNVHPLCAQIFRDVSGRTFRLYRHQADAIDTALRGDHYVLTSGTGSGKSLTYWIPIINDVLHHDPLDPSVRAIIVYPMNALINSQAESIDGLLANLPERDRIVRVSPYTGQESQQERDALRTNPPHILLTNYMMLEYMMVRPGESVFVDRAVSKLKYVVLDELHTYTGRRGADVAMLVRRLRERCGNPDLQCIGTSATMASEGSPAERRDAVAQVASKLFGVTFRREDVIGETLRPVTRRERLPLDPGALRAAMAEPGASTPDADTFAGHPLAVWIEDTMGIADEAGHLVRRQPLAVAEAAARLAEATGRPPDECRSRIEDLMLRGSRVRLDEGEHAFAFKLHQFISQGGAVYATIEHPDERVLTLEASYYAPLGSETKVLYPLSFCRECGQEYYRVIVDPGRDRVLPRSVHDEFVADEELEAGYMFVEHERGALWNDDRVDELPDSWFNIRRSGRRIRSEFASALPRRITIEPDGACSDAGDGIEAWFVSMPLLFCPRCGVLYTRRDREFRKLSHLSSEGRSTATTLLAVSTILQMRDDTELEHSAKKILSFTDVRQDASLQAGHFNDFIHIATLRAAIYRAIVEHGALDHTVMASRVVDALNLPQEAYAKESGEFGDLPQRNRDAFERYIEYRIYEDLRRQWRVVQPSLEQCGLLRIEYKALDRVASDPAAWSSHPILAVASPENRASATHAFLDQMRQSLAIDVPCLEPQNAEPLRRRVSGALKEPWTFDDDETLEEASVYVLPGTEARSRNVFSLSPRSLLGRFLRSRAAWPGIEDTVSESEYGPLFFAFLATLQKAGFVTRVRTDRGEGIRLRADSMMWAVDDNDHVVSDPVRSRWMNRNGNEPYRRPVNAFFKELYRQRARELGTMRAEEHTGETKTSDRMDREAKFRSGELECLFCSPTMELGIDIKDLNVVHMRNVPRTAANYAQRSGRAGRHGQPALILTYCGTWSSHDQYFFDRRVDMVSGVVVPPRFDVTNRELVQAHMQAVWLSAAKPRIGYSIIEVLDVEQDGLPLKDETRHQIRLSTEKERECIEACRQILTVSGDLFEAADWYSDEWLEQVIRSAPERFDTAFERWRQLYRAACDQIQATREIIDRPHRHSRQEVRDAERREREARRERDVLCMRTGSWESEFYPYRYLASEGFLPGYNFPRLPVRLYLPSAGGEGNYLARDRFLAIRDYGPRNVVYYEGRKYRVIQSILPPGEAIPFVTAKMCEACGFFHEGESAAADCCENCGTELDSTHSKYTERLLEHTAVRGARVARITCDEEERRRQGYEITSHFRFASGGNGAGVRGVSGQRFRRVPAVVEATNGGVLLDMAYGPSAALWRVNRKWRGRRTEGFAFDRMTGFWERREGDDEDRLPGAGSPNVVSGVYPFVRNTRNILLVRPGTTLPNESFLPSLEAALSRGIEVAFQVEEQELASMRIGEGSRTGILFWENAEGGIGVLEQLIDDPQAIARIAKVALEVCHFDPESLNDRADDATCSLACYRCLLSYQNQPDHRNLDRHAVADFLGLLRTAVLKRGFAGLSYDEHFRRLRALTDRRSELERRFLDHLFATRRSLPDFAQRYISDYPSCPDFYYEAHRACVFCDGSVHDEPTQRERDSRDRQALREKGYGVIVIRYDSDIEEQLHGCPDLFGGGAS